MLHSILSLSVECDVDNAIELLSTKHASNPAILRYCIYMLKHHSNYTNSFKNFIGFLTWAPVSHSPTLDFNSINKTKEKRWWKQDFLLNYSFLIDWLITHVFDAILSFFIRINRYFKKFGEYKAALIL